MASLSGRPPRQPLSWRLRRRLVSATLILSAMPALLLAVLWLDGRLAFPSALAGLLLLLAATFAILLPHFRHLAALRRFLEALRTRGGEERSLLPPEGASPLLATDLREALVATAEERDRRRREIESLMRGTEAVFAVLPDPLLLLDRRRRILRANPAAQSLLGGPLAGRDLVQVLRNPALLAAAEAAIAGEEGRMIEFTLLKEVERHFNARAVSLANPTSEGVAAVLTLHEITAVRRAERLRADFVANASHELRTPLATLLGFVETLRGPAHEDEQARDRFLAIMEEQARRMTRLVEDLLSLSRIEMREHAPPSETLALRPLLENLAAALEMKARPRDMRIVIRAEEMPPVLGDRDELTQVFQNLLDNAIKYGRPGSAVEVTLRPLAGEEPSARRLGRPGVAVAVRDQGEGIAREHLPRLTERFYRVDAARSRALGGTGLGLAIVKHIVNRHRGLLVIDSTPGEGSIFTVILPLAGGADERHQTVTQT